MKALIFASLFTLVALCYGVESTHHIEWDDATDSIDKFPCYTVPHKQWVSQKYITQRKIIDKKTYRLRRKNYEKRFNAQTGLQQM